MLRRIEEEQQVYQRMGLTGTGSLRYPDMDRCYATYAKKAVMTLL